MDKYNPPINIVLTDDDADDRLFFQLALDGMAINSKLMMKNDGVALMEYLEAAETLPDIIFLDLNMPLKSGYECLREIRSDGKYRKFRRRY
jgi:CheY-like chemotaxis protein